VYCAIGFCFSESAGCFGRRDGRSGLWLMQPTPVFALALLGWLALMIVRMRFEETVLGRAFPEYESYRARVGALAPRLRIPGS